MFFRQKLKVWTDPVTIRSHVIVEGFVKDYFIWKFHGEKDLTTIEHATSDFIDDKGDDLEELCDADQGMLDCGSRNDDSGYGGLQPIPSNSIDDVMTFDDDDDDADDLKEMLKHFKSGVLKNAKGLKHFKAVKDAANQSVYDKEKNCLTHWSMLQFVIELLILKAKYGWSDSSFNDLLELLTSLLPKSTFVPTNTYQAKKVISPLTMGVERIHACPNHCMLY